MKLKKCHGNKNQNIVSHCLLDDLADAIYLIEPETSNVLYVNQTGCDSHGMTRDELLYQSVMSLQEDVINQPQWTEIAEVISQSEEPYLFLGRHKRKDGSVFPVEVRTSNIHRDGKHLFLSIARDITTRAMIDEELKGHQHSLWYALNDATDGIWEWNIQTDEIYVSPKLKQMRGYGPQEPISDVNFWKEGIHPDDIEQVFALLNAHLKGNVDKFEARYRLKTRAGHYIWVQDKGKVSEYGQNGEPLVAVGMVQNITEQVKQQQRLENQASTDELTGAFNRRVCRENIENRIIESEKECNEFSIALLDIDHFKLINDEFGHSAGDMVLKALVERIDRFLGKKGILYRWGGEEFLIFFPSLDSFEALNKLEFLREEIAKSTGVLPLSVDNELTVSVGIASYPLHGTTLGKLVQSADIAMYTAKAKGRNRIEISTKDGSR